MRFCLTIILAGILHCTQAQVSIYGTVADSHQKLPFATVTLFTSDTVLVSGVASDQNGEFVLKNLVPGSYKLKVSMVGYLDHSQEVHLDDKDLLLGEIMMEESATALDEIVIEESKQLFEKQPDRLTINLTSSITSSGSSILDVLQKSPGVTVNRQGGSIAINGRTGVRLMINNKMLTMPMDAVIQMLEGINAGNVEKIELISSPTSAIDAEGNGGIIHIITRSEDEFGTTATMGLTAGMKWAENIGGNTSIRHRTKNFAVALDYALTRDHNQHRFDLTHEYTLSGDLFSSHIYSDRENLTTQQNLNAALEWNPRRNTLVTLLLTGYKRNWHMTAVSNEDDVSPHGLASTQSSIRESNVWQSGTATLGFQRKIDSRNEVEVSLDYLYFHHSNPSSYDYHNDGQNNGNVEDVFLTKETPIRFWVGKADYRFQPLPSLTLETGVKLVTSRLENDVLVHRVDQRETRVDSTLSSFSSVTEDIVAGYVSGQWHDEQNKWRLNGGVRYEHTSMQMGTPEDPAILKRDYGYFFPSLSITRRIASEEEFYLSYNRRITRPTYNDIAPYVFFWGLNIFSSGNTALMPAVADNITAGYNVKQWTFSVYYTDVSNEIATEQPTFDHQSGSLTFRAENLKYLRMIGFGSSVSLMPVKWWEIQSNVSLQYQKAATAHLDVNVVQSLSNANLYVMNRWKLPRNFSAEVTAVYQSKVLTGSTRMLSTFSVNAGIQKSWGLKGIVRLSIDDIFYYTNWRMKFSAAEYNVNTFFNYDWHNQFIRISYTRVLGSKSVKAAKAKSGAEEERKRVN